MRQISVLLFAAVLLTALILPLSAFATPVEVSARHAVMYEATTDTFLYDKNGTDRAPMASTTKIMTALVAIEDGDIDRTIMITDEDCGIEGSSIYMKAGEKLTLRELLYALLLQSANDAAVAIARVIGGSQEGFADKMNARAVSLGLTDTHFVTPHGLDDPAHYTTARDLARIAATALDNPLFRKIVSTVKYNIPGIDGDTRVLVNHNKLLRLYKGSIGVKTGFTKKSGRCLVGAAEKEGLTLVTVTLDAPNDWNDHIRLFDRGFSMLENRCLCDVGQFVYELPVIGKDNCYAYCKNNESVYAVLPPDAPPPEVILDMPHHFLGNEKVGSVVGNISFQYQNKIIAQCPLIFTGGTD